MEEVPRRAGVHPGLRAHLHPVAVRVQHGPRRIAVVLRLQAEALGGLDRGSRRQLKRRGTLETEGLALGVGARLRREWQGRVVEVEVEASGFRWRGTLYPSLSAAASAIAGSRWNGPRFFGLRKSGK